MTSKQIYADAITDTIGTHNGNGRKTLQRELLSRSPKELAGLSKTTRDYQEELKTADPSAVADRMTEVLATHRTTSDIATTVEIEVFEGRQYGHVETRTPTPTTQQQKYNCTTCICKGLGCSNCPVKP